MTLHATHRPVHPHHARKRAPTRPRAGKISCNQRLSFAAKKPQPRLHCSQKFSVVALTTSSAAIAERYAYSAYGAPTVCNASGTDIGTSAKDNRITYTGREWDDELALYHFRARLYDAGVGRFLGRDPKKFNHFFFGYSSMLGQNKTDPSGLEVELSDCLRITRAVENTPPLQCSKRGFRFRIKCDSSDPPQRGLGGRTWCSKTFDDYLLVDVYYKQFRNISDLQRLIDHEMQHVRDVCECKSKCKVLMREPDETTDDYCLAKACLEIRACVVANCKDESGAEKKEFVIECAKFSMRSSAVCSRQQAASAIATSLRDSSCYNDVVVLEPLPY